VHTGFWYGYLREGDILEDAGIDSSKMLKGNFRKWDGGAWAGLIWLRIGAGVGISECGNELSGSTQCGEFLY
jgi:hypothetical protein